MHSQQNIKKSRKSVQPCYRTHHDSVSAYVTSRAIINSVQSITVYYKEIMELLTPTISAMKAE